MVEPHSAAYLGEERDFWWSTDYLGLVVQRLGVADARSVLDVGAGVGHWGRALAPVLSPAAGVLGVEREAVWVKEATRRAGAAGLGERFRYVQGTAEALPFEDAAFDLVTCQTLLIHVADPRAVIREMLRVTKPGGVLLAAEPNNRASALIWTSADETASVDDTLERVRFMLLCENGKKALGEGDNSIGDMLPGWFAEEGLADVRVSLSDEAPFMVPPYPTPKQQTLARFVREQAETAGYGWTRAEARRFYLAGGGEDSDFDLAWTRRTGESARAAAEVEAGIYHSAGGGIMYLVSGRRRVLEGEQKLS